MTHVLVNDPTRGFGMALAMNHPAMNAYAAMDKAHNARSEKEIHDPVNSLTKPCLQ